ncbi:MAG: metal-dependent phosphohydrolase, partial [Anaerolineales bacterium]
MFNPTQLTIDHFAGQLKNAYQRTYSNLDPEISNIVGWTGRLALEIIANSNALYHNLEHTVMVTLAGQAIIEGKHLTEGGVTPVDWMHYMIALLCHDIGYVRGILREDNSPHFSTGTGETVSLPGPFRPNEGILL